MLATTEAVEIFTFVYVVLAVERPNGAVLEVQRVRTQHSNSLVHGMDIVGRGCSPLIGHLSTNFVHSARITR